MKAGGSGLQEGTVSIPGVYGGFLDKVPLARLSVKG
jgi:hypothetical protein